MRILSITAQKPHSTGSGVYLTELVNSFHRLGHEQAVIAGVYKEDVVTFPAEVDFYPAYFCTEKLPFPIAGMSDEMPYKSTIYSQMSEEQVEMFLTAYEGILTKVLQEFKPDLIISHHLFLLTALTRNLTASVCPQTRVVGLCHGSDLRQYKKSKEVKALQSGFIYENLRKLDEIFALHHAQKLDIMKTYDLPENKVRVIGTGYNGDVFRKIGAGNITKDITNFRETEGECREENSGKCRLLFAGKLSKAKGVMSFLKSLEYLNLPEKQLEVFLAGGYGNEIEYQEIQRLAEEAKYEVHFLGRLSQEELARQMNRSDIFVLPSFYEGLPLVLMEAMACGMDIIATDLPGVQDWMKSSIPDNPIDFVTPPKMARVDEPEPGEEILFEKRLAGHIEQSIATRVARKNMERNPDITQSLTKLSWLGICEKIL